MLGARGPGVPLVTTCDFGQLRAPWRSCRTSRMIVPMKLAEKGRYAPPPRLKPAAQRVARAIAMWPGVHARAHWLLGDERAVDGADFYFGEEELGHIHLDSAAHVVHARAIADTLIKAGLGRRFEWSRQVVVFEIRTPNDVAHALWLFELSYARRQGLEVSEILARITAYIAGGARNSRGAARSSR
jgi:hypothetical protein